MSAGTRGKWSEGEVRKKLQQYAAFSSFTFYRLPDARAGSFQPTLADFMTMHKMQFGLLEVKEIEHEYRLDYKNFDEAKVGRMRAWQMAGSQANVVICSKPGKQAVWRVASIDFFFGTKNPDKPSGSWDLRPLAEVSLSTAMEYLYGPPPSIRI